MLIGELSATELRMLCRRKFWLMQIAMWLLLDNVGPNHAMQLFGHSGNLKMALGMLFE